MSKLVNLFGGPGIGKSSIAAGITYKLKKNHISCNNPYEFPKTLAWDKNYPAISGKNKKHCKYCEFVDQYDLCPKENSYTNQLLTKGSNTILKKMGEETAEFVMACMKNDKNEISNEAADIIYHLQVALLLRGIDWRDVLEVLESRRK